jgi:hypothetical protein
MRDKVVIASKFGFDIKAGGLNSRPAHIKQVVEDSLKLHAGQPRREPTDHRCAEADLEAIDATFSKIVVHGGRMNAMQMQVVDR